MDIDTWALRVDKLERQNRWVRVFLLIAVAGVAWPWLSGAAEDPRTQTLRGRRVLLFDGDSKLRAFLGADEEEDGRVGLYLYDRAGKRSAAVYVKDGHAGLALFGDNNTERARLELDEKGTALRLYTADKFERARLGVTGARSGLALGTDAQGAGDQDHTEVHKHGLTLSCVGGMEGYSRLTMGVEETGAYTRFGTGAQGSYLLLRDTDGESRVQLKPSPDSAGIQVSGPHTGSVVAVYDADGHMISTLP